MSDCGVCLYSDCELSGSGDFCDISYRKARKPHKCCECGKVINPGEKYEHYWGKFDGDTAAIDTCIICAEIADAFYCDGRIFNGELWCRMHDVMGELTTSCFDKLQTPAAKEELRRRW